MAISANDLAFRGWKRLRATAGGNAVLPANTRIMAVLLTGGADAATLRLDNAATAGASTDSINLAVATAASIYVTFGPSGTLFDVGVSTAITGTTPPHTIFYVADGA